MFGFVFGAMFLIGLFTLGKVWRGRGGHCHGGHHHGHGWHRGYDGGAGDDDSGRSRRGRGRRRGGRFGAGFVRAAGEAVKRRLDVDEDQEGIVDLALADLRTTVTHLADALRESRSEVVGAFRAETVDEAALDAVFARQDEELARARREAVSALKQIHAVLDADQRAAAASWLDRSDLGYV